jgi:Malate:quinone oxidoreductase (Mqo)
VGGGRHVVCLSVQSTRESKSRLISNDGDIGELRSLSGVSAHLSFQSLGHGRADWHRFYRNVFYAAARRHNHCGNHHRSRHGGRRAEPAQRLAAAHSSYGRHRCRCRRWPRGRMDDKRGDQNSSEFTLKQKAPKLGLVAENEFDRVVRTVEMVDLTSQKYGTGKKTMAMPTPSTKPTDVGLIGAGVISATPAVILKQLAPKLQIEIHEVLSSAAKRTRALCALF